MRMHMLARSVHVSCNASASLPGRRGAPDQTLRAASAAASGTDELFETVARSQSVSQLSYIYSSHLGLHSLRVLCPQTHACNSRGHLSSLSNMEGGSSLRRAFDLCQERIKSGKNMHM
jgi:hypothetical protein